MGSNVIVGISSTKLIGVTSRFFLVNLKVLAFANSELFRLYYFRMYLGMIIMGTFMGVAFLPSLLYDLGPSKPKFKRTKS